MFLYADVAALVGTASYSGAAVGHYATRAQGAHTVDTGRFTATAALTANFDADANPDLAGVDAAGLSVSGRITNFMAEDGTAMPGWLVNLRNGAMLTGIFDAAASTFPATTRNMTPGDDTIVPRASTNGDIYGTTSGTSGGPSGSLSWSGVWDAWLFGNDLTVHPSGIAGRFQASAGTAEPNTSPEGRILLLGPMADQGFAGVTGSFAGR